MVCNQSNGALVEYPESLKLAIQSYSNNNIKRMLNDSSDLLSTLGFEALIHEINPILPTTCLIGRIPKNISFMFNRTNNVVNDKDIQEMYRYLNKTDEIKISLVLRTNSDCKSSLDLINSITNHYIRDQIIESYFNERPKLSIDRVRIPTNLHHDAFLDIEAKIYRSLTVVYEHYDKLEYPYFLFNLSYN